MNKTEQHKKAILEALVNSTDDDNFYKDYDNIKHAYLIGKNLVDSNINKGEGYAGKTYIRS